MTCKYSHMEIGETYIINVNAQCTGCGAITYYEAPMVYQGHKNATAPDGHKYYGDCWKETPSIPCPNCEWSAGYFITPCSKGLADELFVTASVPVEAISK